MLKIWQCQKLFIPSWFNLNLVFMLGYVDNFVHNFGKKNLEMSNVISTFAFTNLTYIVSI